MLFITLAYAGLVTAGVARKIQTPTWDKYAGERGFAGHEDPKHVGHAYAREAEAEAVESFEHAHGGKAPIYNAHAPQHFGHHARDVEEDEEQEIDYSLEGCEHKLTARDAMVRDAEAEGIEHYKKTHGGKAPAYNIHQDPHYAHHARDVEESEEDDYVYEEGTPDLTARDASKYPSHFGPKYADSTIELDRRDVLEDAEEIDYSLEGYDHELVARDYPDFHTKHAHLAHEHMKPKPAYEPRDVRQGEHDFSLDGYDHELVYKNYPEFFTGKYAHLKPAHAKPAYHTRDVEDEEFDETAELNERGLPTEHEHEREHKTHKHESAHPNHHSHTRSDEHSWTKPTHVARALKDLYNHYGSKANEAVEHAKAAASAHPEGAHKQLWARDVKGKLVYSHEPQHGNEFHGSQHHARDYIYEEFSDGTLDPNSEEPELQARDAFSFQRPSAAHPAPTTHVELPCPARQTEINSLVS